MAVVSGPVPVPVPGAKTVGETAVTSIDEKRNCISSRRSVKMKTETRHVFWGEWTLSHVQPQLQTTTTTTQGSLKVVDMTVAPADCDCSRIPLQMALTMAQLDEYMSIYPQCKASLLSRYIQSIGKVLKPLSNLHIYGPDTAGGAGAAATRQDARITGSEGNNGFASAAASTAVVVQQQSSTSTSTSTSTSGGQKAINLLNVITFGRGHSSKSSSKKGRRKSGKGGSGNGSGYSSSGLSSGTDDGSGSASAASASEEDEWGGGISNSSYHASGTSSSDDGGGSSQASRSSRHSRTSGTSPSVNGTGTTARGSNTYVGNTNDELLALQNEQLAVVPQYIKSSNARGGKWCVCRVLFAAMLLLLLLLVVVSDSSELLLYFYSLFYRCVCSQSHTHK